MHPTPKFVGGKWQVDLRTPWNLGRHVLAAAPGDLIGAIHESYALLERLRIDRGIRDSQLVLPGTAGRTLVTAIDAYMAQREWRTAGGKRWGEYAARALKRELGPIPLAQIDAAKLWAYRNEKRGSGLGFRGMETRLVVLEGVLRWASEPPRLWIPFVPPIPSPKMTEDELPPQPLTKWIDEATFRVTRLHLFSTQQSRSALKLACKKAGLPCDDVAIQDAVERRRLYLSFAFYTGMRKHDLDLCDDSYVSQDFGVYWRHGRKTRIEIAAEAMPEPLLRDLESERMRLGRSYRRGEKICGGPWRGVCDAIATAARIAKVERWNLRDARRSFCYHKALADVREEDLVRLMGHVDSRMIHAVYLQLQPRLQRNRDGAAWPKSLTSVPGTGDARIFDLFPPKE